MGCFDHDNAFQSLDGENCSCFARSNLREQSDHAQTTVLVGLSSASISSRSAIRQLVIFERSMQRILAIDPVHWRGIFRSDPDPFGFKSLVCSVQLENEPERNPFQGPFARRQAASHGVPRVSADHHATQKRGGISCGRDGLLSGRRCGLVGDAGATAGIGPRTTKGLDDAL